MSCTKFVQLFVFEDPATDKNKCLPETYRLINTSQIRSVMPWLDEDYNEYSERYCFVFMIDGTKLWVENNYDELVEMLTGEKK